LRKEMNIDRWLAYYLGYCRILNYMSLLVGLVNDPESCVSLWYLWVVKRSPSHNVAEALRREVPIAFGPCPLLACGSGARARNDGRGKESAARM